MTYKCLNGEAPDYLSDLLSVIPESRRMLRSSNKYKQLVVPRVKEKPLQPDHLALWHHHCGMNYQTPYGRPIVWKSLRLN